MSKRLSVLGLQMVSQNITILVTLISLIKYFFYIFTHEYKLKVKLRNFLLFSFCLFFIFFLQLHFNCGLVSPTNFVTCILLDKYGEHEQRAQERTQPMHAIPHKRVRVGRIGCANKPSCVECKMAQDQVKDWEMGLKNKYE